MHLCDSAINCAAVMSKEKKYGSAIYLDKIRSRELILKQLLNRWKYIYTLYGRDGPNVRDIRNKIVNQVFGVIRAEAEYSRANNAQLLITMDGIQASKDIADSMAVAAEPGEYVHLPNLVTGIATLLQLRGVDSIEEMTVLYDRSLETMDDGNIEAGKRHMANTQSYHLVEKEDGRPPLIRSHGRKHLRQRPESHHSSFRKTVTKKIQPNRT